MPLEPFGMRGSKYVKGVFISRFDLSFGPTPVARYPIDFITEEQSRTMAMYSMIQLNTTKGETATTMLTADDIGAIGIGILGRIAEIGLCSIIIFLSLDVPRAVLNKIGNVIRLLSSFNAGFEDRRSADEYLAKQVYLESCRLLDLGDEESHGQEESYHSRVSDVIAQIVEVISPVINIDLKAIAPLDAKLVDSLIELIHSLYLVSGSLGLTSASSSLRILLFEIEKVRFSDG